MTRMLALALSVLTAGSVAVAAPLTVSVRAAVEWKRPPLAEVCSGAALPFPVPDIAAPTDAALERWAADAWDELCADSKSLAPASYVRRACKCRPSK